MKQTPAGIKIRCGTLHDGCHKSVCKISVELDSSASPGTGRKTSFICHAWKYIQYAVRFACDRFQGIQVFAVMDSEVGKHRICDHGLRILLGVKENRKVFAACFLTDNDLKSTVINIIF